MAQAWARLAPIVLALVFLFGLIASAMKVYQFGIDQRPAQLAPLSQVGVKFIPVLTFGYKNLYDDFLHIWLLQSVVEAKAQPEPRRVIDLIRSAVKQRPKIETLYMLSCFVAFEDLKQPEVCQEIILGGLEVFPDSWRLPMTQGFVHAFITKRPLDAANFYLLAASRKSSPPYVARLAKKLVQKEGLTEEDYRRSLEIMLGTEHGVRFRQFLQEHGKYEAGKGTDPYGISN